MIYNTLANAHLYQGISDWLQKGLESLIHSNFTRKLSHILNIIRCSKLRKMQFHLPVMRFPLPSNWIDMLRGRSAMTSTLQLMCTASSHGPRQSIQNFVWLLPVGLCCHHHQMSMSARYMVLFQRAMGTF